MADILVVGSASVDHSLVVPCLAAAGETIRADAFDEKIGGKGVNQAVAAALAGGSVDIVTCISDDRPGRLIWDTVLAEGIGVGGPASPTRDLALRW
ncbi:PfkB family carbohydrate kinase [Sphingomonas bacterium]|uniref:PfkB family carbohydrate kinase n=1 Tax=Sphingomonas bacterium TaxID=1895847 RepID=UPI001574EEFA|nr:PfkB family carbohydrate kinase [Sphingomonas bacterium]